MASKSSPKKKSNTPPPAGPSVSPALKAQIDELGALELELAPMRPKIKRAEALRKSVAAAFTGAPEESGKLDGDKFIALIGERSNQRSITSMPKLFAILKKDVFLENCSFTLGKLEELVPPDLQIGLIEEKRTGSRTVTTYKLAA